MKINDKNIYIAFIATPLAIAVILCGISSYSLFVKEPAIQKLLSSPETLQDAYIELREPQLFAGYKNWDREGTGVLNTMRFFDKRVYSGAGIKPEERPYIELLFKRRHSGAMLGMKTAAFFLILSLCGCAAFAIDRKRETKE